MDMSAPSAANRNAVVYLIFFLSEYEGVLFYYSVIALGV